MILGVDGGEKMMGSSLSHIVEMNVGKYKSDTLLTFNACEI
jgi:hypothetical protein